MSNQKCLVRISPLLLGRVGAAAMKVEVGSLVRFPLTDLGYVTTSWHMMHHTVHIVQFAGKCMHYNDAQEWNVTHAILSNSLAVSSPETRHKRNEQVDAVMHEHGLVHIGWLRQASKLCPLSSLDLDTQRVYEKHLPDAFAALLDLSPGAQEPTVYFYCLVKAAHSNSTGDAFVAAHHVVLDSSVPYHIIEVSLPDLGKGGAPAQQQETEGDAMQVIEPMRQLQMTSCQQQQQQSSGLPSRQSDETDNTDVAVNCFSTEALPLQAVSADDVMSMSIL